MTKIEDTLTGSSPLLIALNAVGVSKSYGDHEVLSEVDLQIVRGEVTCLVGPSGAGKTTLLRCLAGLTAVSRGTVHLGEIQVTGPVDEIAVVFQDYRGSLLPWMRILQNVAFPLEGRNVPRAERRERARAALAIVGLDHVQNKYPWELSGGMQQRVAIARALAYEAPIMLMDEPFGSLDAQTRYELEELVLKLREDLGITIIVVTHDIDEAVFLGDRVVIFGGRPSTVVETVEIPLGRTRDQIATKRTPEYGELRARVLAEVKQIATSR